MKFLTLKKGERDMHKRTDTLSIRLKVMIALAFFNKVELEIREREFGYQMEEDLKKWAKVKKLKFSVRNIEKPYYVIGHAACKINENERYKILSFSK